MTAAHSLTPDQRHGAELLRAELQRLHDARLDLMALHLGANEISAHYELPLPSGFFAFADDLTAIKGALDKVDALLALQKGAG